MICCPAAFHSSFDYLIHLILLCAWQLHSCFPGSACKFAVLEYSSYFGLEGYS